VHGPITANNPMGVHHARGRTYKDLFQRYRAMRGFEQRFQNGFDCQGLWVEVEVEKALGFRRQARDRGDGARSLRARVSRACRVVVALPLLTARPSRRGRLLDS
jgi:isoleucyl-tRNA synthetase